MPQPEAAVECAWQMAQLPHFIGAFTRNGYPDAGWYEDAEILRWFARF
jgi:hypothetical protein